MNSMKRSLILRQKHMVLTYGFFCVLLLVAPTASAQQTTPSQPADQPVDIDLIIVGEPEKINLGDGKFKKVFRNKAGQIVKEEEFISKGTVVRIAARVRKVDVSKVYRNGKVAQASVSQYDEDEELIDISSVKYDSDGKPVEKVTYTGKVKDPDTRTVTTYPPGSGPDGVSRTEKKNAKTGKFEPVPTPPQPSTPATPPATPPTPPSPQPPSSDEKTDEVMVNYTPQHEFYFGFSHNRVDGGDEREGFNGFATSFTWNISRYVAPKVYYSFHRRSFEESRFNFSPAASIHEFLFGVQFKDHASEGSRLRPLVHLMAGLAHHRFSFDDGTNSVSDSRTGFAGVIGGGLDIRINDRIDLRTQFDYNPNHIDEWQHNVSAGAGIVIKLGRHSDDDVDSETDPEDPSVAAVPQDPNAKKCEWNRHNLGKDTHVTEVKSDKPRVVEVRIENISGSGGFEYHCLQSSGTALITYKYTDVNGANQEGKLRVFCN